jgi:hypothetical protein
MSEPQLNLELFRQIREKIASTPVAYDQTRWGRREIAAPCGTAACIAGWACVLSGSASLSTVQSAGTGAVVYTPSGSLDIPATAQRVLGLSEEEADVLFTSDPEGEWGNEDYDDDDEDDDGVDDETYYLGGGWPEEFAVSWRGALTPEEQASIAIAYIDHIIETGEVLE